MKISLPVVMIVSLIFPACDRQTAEPGRAVPAEESVITGRIIGYDSKAPALARVDVFEPDREDTPKRIQTAPDGSFSVTTAQTGIVRLNFAAALHESFSVPFLLLKPSHVEIEVRLVPYDWQDKIDEVIVIGDFNRFSRTVGSVVMVRQPNGTFAAEFGNLAGNKLGYRLAGLVKESTRSVPGTYYDEMISDPGGGFVSLLKIRDGRVRIVFDSATLPRGSGEAGVTFADGDSEIARVAGLDLQMRRREQEYSRFVARLRVSNQYDPNFHYDWSRTVAELKRLIAEEMDPYVRQMLFISLLDLRRLRAQEIDVATAGQALETIPPDSPLWQLAPRDLMFSTIQLAGGLGLHKGYFDKMVAGLSSREARALLLEQAYGEAVSSRNMDQAQEFYKRLTTEFADLLPGQRVKSHPPENAIGPGK